MKEIQVTETKQVTKYQASDGTIFLDKAECDKYEQSALGMLMAKYKPLVVKTINEYDLFDEHGSADVIIDIVKPTSEKDVDTIMQIAMIMCCTHYKEIRNSYMDKTMNKLRRALDKNDYIFISRDCAGEVFYVHSSLQDTIQKILENCTPDKKDEGTKVEY